MEINWYTLSRQWFDFSFENPDKVNCSHTALYFYIIDKWNRFWQKEKFGLPSYYTMEELWIKSRKTYYKIFKDLVDFWFIEIIQESVNQNTSTIIKLNLTKNVWWKSKLDDAMCLLNNYPSNDTSTYPSNDTSTYPSRGTIDKQVNKETKKQEFIDFSNLWKENKSMMSSYLIYVFLDLWYIPSNTETIESFKLWFKEKILDSYKIDNTSQIKSVIDNYHSYWQDQEKKPKVFKSSFLNSPILNKLK